MGEGLFDICKDDELVYNDTIVPQREQSVPTSMMIIGLARQEERFRLEDITRPTQDRQRAMNLVKKYIDSGEVSIHDLQGI